MRFYRITAAAVIGSLLCSMAVFAAPQTTMESYEKDGRKYIKKTYTIGTEEEILDVADSAFELNGFTYHQIDISNAPVVEVLTKEVEQKESTSVSAQNEAAVLEKLGETREYSDEEGYRATLEPDTASISYTVSGYTTKTMTKDGNRRYYNLPSMDTSQIAKGVWSGGVYLKLIDVKWIGDNNSASADSAVGNNYAAIGYYRGTYDVRIPTGYTAEVVYKGVAEKEFSEQTAYTITYLGEETAPQEEKKDFPIGFAIGGGALALGLMGTGAYLFLKFRKKATAETEGLDEDMEQEDDEDIDKELEQEDENEDEKDEL